VRSITTPRKRREGERWRYHNRRASPSDVCAVCYPFSSGRMTEPFMGANDLLHRRRGLGARGLLVIQPVVISCVDPVYLRLMLGFDDQRFDVPLSRDEEYASKGTYRHVKTKVEDAVKYSALRKEGVRLLRWKCWRRLVSRLQIKAWFSLIQCWRTASG